MTAHMTSIAGADRHAADNSIQTAVVRETVALLAASAPFAAIGLLHMAVSITDSAMIGALGPVALSTSALVSDARSIVFYFVGGGFIALAPLIAAASVSGDEARLRRMFAAGLQLAIVLAALGFPVVMSLGWMLPAMGIVVPDPGGAVAYSVSLAFACAAMVFAQFARSVLAPLGRGRSVVVVMAAVVPLNAALNALLMFGPAGFPRMGIAGAGYGTALAYAVVTVGLLALAHRAVEVSPTRALSMRSGSLRPLGAATLMTGFGMLCETGLYLTATLVVGRMAPGATTEHVIAFRILGVCYCIYVGVGQAASIMAARGVASGGRGTAATSMLAATLIAGVACGAAAHGAVQTLVETGLGAGVTATPGIADHVAAAVFVLAFAAVGLNVLRGQGAVRSSAVVAAAGYWGAGCLALAAIVAGGGADLLGIWEALFAGTAATGVAAWTLILRNGLASSRSA